VAATWEMLWAILLTTGWKRSYMKTVVLESSDRNEARFMNCGYSEAEVLALLIEASIKLGNAYYTIAQMRPDPVRAPGRVTLLEGTKDTCSVIFAGSLKAELDVEIGSLATERPFEV
jgi:hypothetical protein